MNRMERIINLFGELVDEVSLLSNDDFQLEDEEDYAEVVGKQKVIKEMLTDILFLFEKYCIDDLGLTEEEVNEARERKSRCR